MVPRSHNSIHYHLFHLSPLGYISYLPFNVALELRLYDNWQQTFAHYITVEFYHIVIYLVPKSRLLVQASCPETEKYWGMGSEASWMPIPPWPSIKYYTKLFNHIVLNIYMYSVCAGKATCPRASGSGMAQAIHTHNLYCITPLYLYCKTACYIVRNILLTVYYTWYCCGVATLCACCKQYHSADGLSINQNLLNNKTRLGQ